MPLNGLDDLRINTSAAINAETLATDSSELSKISVTFMFDFFFGRVGVKRKKSRLPTRDAH